MNNVPVEVALESPVLYIILAYSLATMGVVLTAIGLFVRYLRHRDSRDDVRTNQFQQTARELSTSCHAVQRESHEVIREAADALAVSNDVIRELEQTGRIKPRRRGDSTPPGPSPLTPGGPA